MRLHLLLLLLGRFLLHLVALLDLLLQLTTQGPLLLLVLGRQSWSQPLPLVHPLLMLLLAKLPLLPVGDPPLLRSGRNIDADQRITHDVKKLTTDLSSLVTGMVKLSADILWFTWRMKLLTSQRGVAILYAYMLLGLGFLRSVAPEFGDLACKEQQLEGTFRFMHNRLRTHAESVAFFIGGSREKAVRYLDRPLNRQLDALRFLASVVSQSFLAFGDILELHRNYLELTGGINRIFELEEFLDAAQNDIKLTQHSSTSSSIASVGDAYEQVLGRDRIGRVCGIGTDPIPKRPLCQALGCMDRNPKRPDPLSKLGPRP
ncbi:hypothetical protein Taro_015178 [Colocasia esculenta]|uniref:ABC transmembrane type-1 domain-containing protein n=1 Tax=Colocasia esculenta TaxID=4460 RepID=A0A843UKN6_COLES|nr:hypothetical protein [Colocasia esculenta]